MVAKQLTAKDITALLSVRHKNDLFVPECKLGSTWEGCGGAHQRFDAWAMKRSWTQPNTWGYEVKVRRSDFIDDTKWPGYLAHCNQFSFVCPWGLIKPEELHEGCGLIWVTQGGRRLIAKVAAPRRDIEPPVELMTYVLMSRTEIRGRLGIDGLPMSATRERSLNYWRAWLAEKEESRELGYEVSAAIRARVVAADNEAEKAQKLMVRVNEVDRILQSTLGVSLSGLSSWCIERDILNAVSLVPESLINKLGSVRAALGEAEKQLQAFRDRMLCKQARAEQERLL